MIDLGSWKAPLGVVVLLVVAGCTMTGSYDGVSVSVDSITEASGTVTIEGEVATSPAPESDLDFQDVRVVTYSREKQVLNATTVGNLSQRDTGPYPESQPFTLTVSTRPHYIRIESPDFWTTNEDLSVTHLEWTDGEYQPYDQTTRDDKFPDD